MNKKILILSSLLININVFSQIGINTLTPQVTLDIKGSPDSPEITDGIIIPRINAIQLKNKIYTNEQKGALIYVTDIFDDLNDATGQVQRVKSIGLYEFDGTQWRKLSNNNIHNLFSVVNNGNFTNKPIAFTGDLNTEQGTSEAHIGYNSNTRSFYFGEINPNHTGTDNIGIGYQSLNKLETGTGNVSIGNQSSKNIIGSSYNTILGLKAFEQFTGDKNTAVGLYTLGQAWIGDENTVIGQQAMTEMKNNNNINNRLINFNTAIGSNALRLANSPFSNITIGRNSGLALTGTNNILLGNGVGLNSAFNPTDYNKLYIHSLRMKREANGGTEIANIGNNTLIYGDFNQRWLRVNGKLRLAPNYIDSELSEYKKILVFNPTTGNISTNDSEVILPEPINNATSILKSINGVIQWINE